MCAVCSRCKRFRPTYCARRLACFPSGVCAYRIGALVSSENVRTVAQFLRENVHVPLVVDPVVAVTLGGELRSDDELPSVLAHELLSLGAIVAPNLNEAAALTGLRVRTVDEMRIAGRRLLDLGARAAYVKGGHLHGEPTDVLVAPRRRARLYERAHRGLHARRRLHAGSRTGVRTRIGTRSGIRPRNPRVHTCARASLQRPCAAACRSRFEVRAKRRAR